MGHFSKVKTTKVTPSGQYFKPGNYTVKIKGCKVVESQRDNRAFFVVETVVLESTNAEITEGMDRSHVIDLSKVMGMPDIKAFVAAASGVDPFSEAIDTLVEEEWARRLEKMGVTEKADYEQICELIVNEEINPLEGQVMKLECVNITKKSDGGDFTKHNWQPYEG
jgi:hypothetical protein